MPRGTPIKLLHFAGDFDPYNTCSVPWADITSLRESVTNLLNRFIRFAAQLSRPCPEPIAMHGRTCATPVGSGHPSHHIQRPFRVQRDRRERALVQNFKFSYAWYARRSHVCGRRTTPPRTLRELSPSLSRTCDRLQQATAWIVIRSLHHFGAIQTVDR